MLIEGNYQKTNTEWTFYIPLLDLAETGSVKQSTAQRLLDKVQIHVEILTQKLITLRIVKWKDQKFFIQANDPAIFALILSRQRQKKKLKSTEIAKKLNYSSTRAYTQYEKAKRVPHIVTLNKLLRTIDPGIELLVSFEELEESQTHEET